MSEETVCVDGSNGLSTVRDRWYHVVCCCWVSYDTDDDVTKVYSGSEVTTVVVPDAVGWSPGSMVEFSDVFPRYFDACVRCTSCDGCETVAPSGDHPVCFGKWLGVRRVVS